MTFNLTKNKKSLFIPFIMLLLGVLLLCHEKHVGSHTRIVPVSDGWAKNSINAVIFRRNSIVSHHDHQVVAFYDAQANVILARRKLGTEKWEIHKTKYKGDVKDAHNCISIMVDGDGVLHMAWDHHGSPLRYCRSKFPESLELGEPMVMTGSKEQNVTYPEFHHLPDGNLIFLYRDGSSGSGNLVMNYYQLKTKKWSNLHQNLIDGENQRNAYWQMTIDSQGTLHLSWVWRETWDVATNHDICYAKSTDQGKTWQKSTGEKYQLPITAESAEVAAHIPQRRELINQTSMCVDSRGRPYISNYWTPEDSQIPQYHVVYHDGLTWKTQQISNRKKGFSLSGGGTKRIPISRPQILADTEDVIYLIYRDAEHHDRVSMAMCSNLEKNIWTIQDLTFFSVGQWEPTYDTELWKSTQELHLFIQNVGQGDQETLDEIPSQMVSVLEWKSNY